MSTTRRPTRSLKQEYEEFILQRIEEYKDSLTRGELLEIGDEAFRELEAGDTEQYVLAEVLLLEHVDRIIMRRLKLPTYRRWRSKYVTLRRAQRDPTHWSLDANPMFRRYVRGIEPNDAALVIGGHQGDVALFIAAHDAQVTLLDNDFAAVEMAESRAVSEQLAARVEAYVVTFAGWLPSCEPSLVVLDVGTLATADAEARDTLIRSIKGCTKPGGRHLIYAPVVPRADSSHLMPNALKQHYHDWEIDRGTRRGAPQGFGARKPT